MYNDKEVAALIKSYNKHGGDMSPESFIKSVDKYDGWKSNEMEPAIISDDEDEKPGAMFLVKMGMMLPVPSEKVGLYASEEEILKEFVNMYPSLVNSYEEDKDRLFLLKNGDMNGLAYTGGEVEEKVDGYAEPDFGKEELGRSEMLIKKIVFEDKTWNTLTYDVTSGHKSEGFNTALALDTLLSAVISVVRNSGEDEAMHMQKAQDYLNTLFVDTGLNPVPVNLDEDED